MPSGMGAAGDADVSPAHLAALSSLAIDAVVVEVLSTFDAEGITGVLLKGRSLKRLLYGEHEPRNYVDGDLLIQATRRPVAERLLESRGFERERDASWIKGWMNPSEPWIRRTDGAMIDLHVNIPGTGVDAETLWTVLASELESMRIAGADVKVLSPPAVALHVALHVAQHDGKMNQPLRDLERAIIRLDLSTWAHAVRLAAELDAVPGLALGLAALPAGVSLAQRLNLPTGAEAERTMQRTRLTYALRTLAESPSWTTRVRMLRSKALPSSDFMRGWSTLASRGRIGLGLAYAWRPVWLLGRSLTAVRQRQRSRRQRGR